MTHLSSMKCLNVISTVLLYWLLAHAAWATEQHSVFDQRGAPARNLTIDPSTGEPVPTAPADDLARYRAQFLNATTAQAMQGFIDQHQGKDPERLIPRAKIRARTFAAFEAASATHQCAEAQTLHQRITGYKVSLAFSFADCEGARLALANKPQNTTTPPSDSAALDSRSPTSTTKPLTGEPLTANACPKDLGYLRPRMVFAELRDNPNFAEPIEGIIHKAGGLEAAITEVERLIQINQRSLYRAANTLLQTPGANLGEARNYRCEKPEGDWCAANYYYHLLREGQFYYAELLNGLRCRQTGKMLKAAYVPAPLQRSSVFKPGPPGIFSQPAQEPRP